jgi:MFS family permease
MIERLRNLLAAFFRLLPISVSEDELKTVDQPTREAFPANFSAIASNGFFFPTAGRIVAAGLLLTWFVSELSESAIWVSLIIPIQYGLALIAQPLFAQWLSRKPQRKQYYTMQALLRGMVWGILGLAAVALPTNTPAILLLIFFGVVIIDAVAAGLGNIAFSDTLAQAIPPHLRGRVRGWRGIFGGIVTAFFGIWIQTSYSEDSGLRAYGLLFMAAGILYAIGGLVFGLTRVKDANVSESSKPGLTQLIARIREMWGKGDFRRFVYVQALLTPLVQGLPFFTLFAKERFGLEIDALGVLVIVSAVVPIVSNYVWGRLADARGNRFTLITSGLVGLAAPACVYLLFAQETASTSTIVLLAVIVTAIGAIAAGFDLTTKNYILALSPSEDERPFYIGVNDTLVGLPTTLLVATGFIIDAFGFVPIFVGVAVLTILAIVMATRLPRDEELGAVEKVTELAKGG